MPEVRHSVCALDCPDCCSLLVNVDDGNGSQLRGDPNHPVTRGFLCGKVARYLEREYSPDRLLYPQQRISVKGQGKFQRISWDLTLDTIAQRLTAISKEYGPEAILPYSYAGTMGFLNGSGMDRREFGAETLDYRPPIDSRLGAEELRARFPLEMISNKSNDSMNSAFGNQSWTRNQTSVLFLNKSDASPRGISSGDRVRVFNSLGSCLLHAEVDAAVRPGVVSAPSVRWNKLAPDAQHERVHVRSFDGHRRRSYVLQLPGRGGEVRRLKFVIPIALVLVAAGCKQHRKYAVPKVADEPTLASTISTADPRSGPQLIRGFYSVETDAWRWTQKSFAVSLAPRRNAAQTGPQLVFQFAIPGVIIQKLKSLTLSAAVAGLVLAPETYMTEGQFTYTRDVPADRLGADTVTVEFTLDKALPPTGDVYRELGIVALQVGLQVK